MFEISIIQNFAICLGLTIIFELLIGFILGYRDRLSLLSIICINFITNPLINYLLYLNDNFHFITSRYAFIGILEFLVVIVETILLIYALKKPLKDMLTLSVCLNCGSFLSGLILFKFFPEIFV